MLFRSTGYLSEPSFIRDYHRFHPIEDDLEIFQQVGVQIDPMRVEYLKEGVGMNKYVSNPNSGTQEPYMANGATALNVEMDESMMSVKSLFPQFSLDFIAKCLSYYDGDLEKVINALLEENLPPHLAELSRATENPSPEPPKLEEENKPEEVFGMDVSRLHRGKKKMAKNLYALLDDKSELAGMKDKFAALSMISDEIYLNPEDADYDDEYDEIGRAHV